MDRRSCNGVDETGNVYTPFEKKRDVIYSKPAYDDENDCATDEYKFYDKVIVKDFEGNTVSEEVGSIYQAADGTYWMA